MCTVTWLATERDGSSSCDYDLLCSRDERHERAEALPPTLQERDGVRFVAPSDPDGGGTWIAANEHGLSLCLLNGYAAEDDLLRSSAFTSRGLLVHDLATADGPDDVAAALRERALDTFRSFRLLMIAADGTPRTAVWNRASGRLSFEVPQLPLISCPVRTDDVRAARRRVLDAMIEERGQLDVGVLEAFHRSRHPDAWIWSVSMHHDVAATRSLSHVRVTRDAVTFTYTPGRPCETAPGPAVTLPRRPAS